MAEPNIFDTLDLDSSRVNIKEALGTNDTPTEVQQGIDTETIETPEGSVQVPGATEEVQEFSFREGLDHALTYETLLGYGMRAAMAPEFEPDPNLNLTVGWFEENYADIPREFRDELYQGESLAEIDSIAINLRQRIAAQDRFDAMDPASQIGTLLTATVADAPAIAASLLSGAGTTAGLARIGITGSKITKVLAGAAGVGIESAIQEAILSTADPLKNEKTTALAGLVGFGMGAAGSTLAQGYVSRQIRKAALKDQQRLTESLIKDTAAELAASKPNMAQTLNNTTAMTNIGDQSFTDITETPLEVLYKDVPEVEYSPLRSAAIDQTSRLKRSKSEGIRQLGAILGEDGIFGGNTTMALDFDVTSRPILADGLKGVNEGYNAWAKESGVGFAGRIGHRGREAFNEDVALAVRGVRKPANAGEARAVQSARTFFARMLETARAAGVKGFEEIPGNEQYLTRMYSKQGFTRLTEQYGKQAPVIAQRVIKNAIMSGQDNQFDEALAGKIAKGIYNRTVSTQLRDDHQFTTVITNNFKDELAGILENAEIEADEITKILAKLQAKQGSEVSVTKNRISLDEGYVDPETGIKFTDLLENNTEQIMVRYARQVGGAASAAKFGFDTPQALINNIERTVQKAVDQGEIKPWEAKLSRSNALNLANQILGRPNEDHNVFNQAGQILMDYEYIRTSGGFALASLPEMLITTAENGFRTTMRHVPIANKFIDDVRKGVEPDKDLMSVLESWGVGRDIDMMNAFVRIAEDDALGSNLARGVKALNVGKRVAGHLSGLPQLTRFSQMLAGKSTIQKFSDMAMSGKPVQLKKWLNQLGFMDEQQLEDVFTGLRKHSILQEGVTKNRKVVGLDYDAWVREDPVAAHRFMYAVARRVNHQIQRNLPGEVPEFMSKTLWKMLFQFRTFGMAAHGKKMLNAMHRRDLDSAVGIGLTTAAAGLVYSARIYALSLTRDDPERFREENLNPATIVKSSIQRSGYAALLPSMLDTGLSAFGQDKFFNEFSRTSGLDVGGVDSVPSFTTARNLAETVGRGAEIALTDEELQENDVRKATDMLPLRRLPGVNMLFETMINSFPEKGREQ